MTIINLRTVWLNDASNLDDKISLPSMSALEVATTAEGSVRQYASGRRRVITRGQAGKTASLSVVGADRATVTWLENHVGELLCVRDDRGRKFYGVYFAVGVAEHGPSKVYGNLSLEIQQVTFSEAVV